MRRLPAHDRRDLDMVENGPRSAPRDHGGTALAQAEALGAARRPGRALAGLSACGALLHSTLARAVPSTPDACCFAPDETCRPGRRLSAMRDIADGRVKMNIHAIAGKRAGDSVSSLIEDLARSRKNETEFGTVHAASRL